jgi:hypothetical protein
MELSEIDPAGTWAPEACTLPASERPRRAAAFDGLFTEAVRGIERAGPTRLRLDLQPSPQAAARAAEIDRHRLRVPEQAGECRRAERSIRVARGGGILDSPEQPAVRLQGGDLDIGRAVDPLGESSHRPDERTGHRRRNGLQRLQGGVDCPGPLGEVCLPRPPALRPGGVLAVVAGQVQVLDAGKRVPLQDPGLGSGVGGLLGGAEMTLVVAVGEALARR